MTITFAATDTTCTATKHGTRWAYDRYRCRCPEARAAHAARERNRRHKTGRQSIAYHRDVDPVAVDRAIAGDIHGHRIGTNERMQAVAHLTARGLSARLISERLGITERGVFRLRARHRHLTEQGAAE